MFTKLLRENNVVSIVLAVVRVYLGYSWMTGGWGKITGGGFDASGFLQGAIANAGGDHPAVQGWWASFLEGVALPNASLFSTMVMWGEFLAGLGLILGLFTTAAAFFAAVMNFSFLFSGTVSTNAQMVLLTVFILVAGANAGKYGLDRYALPHLRKAFNKEADNTVKTTA